MKLTFQERLRRVMLGGNLTVADLARWFDRPDPTVRGWARGENPRGAQLDIAYTEARLAQIETRIKNRQGLPVPRMALSAHKTYVLKLVDGKA